MKKLKFSWPWEDRSDPDVPPEKEPESDDPRPPPGRPTGRGPGGVKRAPPKAKNPFGRQPLERSEPDKRQRRRDLNAEAKWN